MSAEAQDRKIKQLLYLASHRGMKEADSIVGGFAAERIHQLGPEQLVQFEKLLHQPDQDILDWLVGRTTPEDGLAGICDLIINYLNKR